MSSLCFGMRVMAWFTWLYWYVDACLGKYMSQYEWAELTNAWLEKRESRL